MFFPKNSFLNRGKKKTFTQKLLRGAFDLSTLFLGSRLCYYFTTVQRNEINNRSAELSPAAD